jgi:hypothetical protein
MPVCPCSTKSPSIKSTTSKASSATHDWQASLGAVQKNPTYRRNNAYLYAAEEPKEAAQPFIMLRGVEARLLTQAQADDWVATFG